MFDAHCALPPATLIQLASAIQPYDVLFIEEPAVPGNIEVFKRIKAAVNVPLAAGERDRTIWEMLPYLQHRCLDILQPDCCHTGGISQMKKIATLAEAYHVPLAPHCTASFLGIAASLHVIASIPLFLIHEFYPDNHGFNPKGIGRVPWKLDATGHIGLPPGPVTGRGDRREVAGERGAQAADVPLAGGALARWVDRGLLTGERDMDIQGECATRVSTEVRRWSPAASREARRGGVPPCASAWKGEPSLICGAASPTAAPAGPGSRDTLGVDWSCTKGAGSLRPPSRLARLCSTSMRPVARYWPEFRPRRATEAITVRLPAQPSGRAAAACAQPLRPGGLFDWDTWPRCWRTKLSPFWEPGTRQGYHATTFGHLIGEVVRHFSGKNLAEFFRDELAGPLPPRRSRAARSGRTGAWRPTIRPDPDACSGEVPSALP